MTPWGQVYLSARTSQFLGASLTRQAKSNDRGYERARRERLLVLPRLIVFHSFSAPNFTSCHNADCPDIDDGAAPQSADRRARVAGYGGTPMSFYRSMTCENVTINGDNGTPITAYVAKPSGPGTVPGVVLIHHLPG